MAASTHWGFLIMQALLSGVYGKTPEFWKLPYLGTQEPRCKKPAAHQGRAPCFQKEPNELEERRN